MSKVTSFKRLVAYMSGLVLMFLGIFLVPQLGVAKMIFGNLTATEVIYPIVGTIIQIASYIALLGIIGLMFWAVISYVRNRGKAELPSPELTAIKELGTKIDNQSRNTQRIINAIDNLVNEIRQERNERKK